MKYQKSITAVSLCAAFFLLYIGIMPPTVYWQDAGIYLGGIYVEGNVYPPGFPLYMVFAIIWSKIIPIGGFTQRIHAFSALFAAISCSIVYITMVDILKNILTLFKKKDLLLKDNNAGESKKNLQAAVQESHSHQILVEIVSIFTSLLIGLNYNVWAQAINAEVYTFHLFFLTFIVYLIIKVGLKGRIERVIDPIQKNTIIVIGILYGLSFGNHPMTIILIPVFLFIAISQRNLFYHTKLLVIVFILFIITGFLPYLYLPVVAHNHPPLNWGNPGNLSRFLTHVSGKAYLTTEESFVFTDITRYSAALNEFIWEFSYAGLVLAALGAYCIAKRNQMVAIILGLILVFHIIFAVLYKQTTEYNSWLIPGHFAITVYIAYALFDGFNYLSSKVTNKNPLQSANKNNVPEYIYTAAFLLVTMLFFFFITTHWYANFKELDRRHYYYAEDFGKNILRNLDRNSIIIMTGDQESSTVMYLQTVLKYRTDIIAFKNIEADELVSSEGREEIHLRYPSLDLPAKEESEITEGSESYYNRLIESNINKRSMYVMSKNIFPLDLSKYRLIPAAAMYKIVPISCVDCDAKVDKKYWDLEYHDPQFYAKKERALMSLKDSTKPGGINRVPFIQHMINFELQSWKNLGDLYIQRGECKLAADSYNKMIHLQKDIFEILPQIKQNNNTCSEK